MSLKYEIERELEGIYRELDEELAKVSPGCNACGECCHFDKFDHVLYASVVEVDYIKGKAAAPPHGHSDKFDKNVCPFLLDHKCTIRDHRTLGCRVFYCNPDYQKNLSPEIYNKYHRKIKDLADAYGLDWLYAPFLKLLYQE